MAQDHPLIIEVGQGLSLMLGLPTIVTWESESRPSEPKRGTFGFNSETGNLEYWDGTGWFEAPMKQA